MRREKGVCFSGVLYSPLMLSSLTLCTLTKSSWYLPVLHYNYSGNLSYLFRGVLYSSPVLHYTVGTCHTECLFSGVYIY